MKSVFENPIGWCLVRSTEGLARKIVAKVPSYATSGAFAFEESDLLERKGGKALGEEIQRTVKTCKPCNGTGPDRYVLLNQCGTAELIAKTEVEINYRPAKVRQATCQSAQQNCVCV